MPSPVSTRPDRRGDYTGISTAAPPEPFEDDLQKGQTAFASATPAPPESRDLAWGDNFFDGDTEVIAVFDFDYATMESFYTSVGFAQLAATALYPPILGVTLVSLAPCFLQNNVRWNVRAQHVALTPDGIRFVRDRRKTCWGLPCTDAGRSSKTVPYDKITDCDIEEPAGNTCLCVKNVLATVNIDTASSGGPHHELRISGLRDPHGFKKLVWAMKRMNAGQIPALGTSPAPPVASSIVRGAVEGEESGNGETEVGNVGSIASLLREIRDELRELRQPGQHGITTAASVGLSNVAGGGEEEEGKFVGVNGEMELPSLD